MKSEGIPADGLARAEARLPRWMAGIAGLGAIGIFAFAGSRAAFSFTLGGVISILGYRWLARAVAAALYASEKPVAKGIVRNFILRYVLAFGAVLAVYETHLLPVAWMIAGLLVPAAGAMAESLLLLVKLAGKPQDSSFNPASGAR